MNTKQSRFAIVSLLVLNTAVLLFHIAIVTKIAPYNIAWGGSLKTDSEMYVFEAISILINLLFSFTLLIKGNFIRPLLSSKTVQVLLWIFFVIYALNTVGNLFAVTSFEKYFAILTFLFAFLIGLIIFKKKLS
ncbi:hypothetical protein [Chitinophaga defluvii]|uniref:Uncharacterized protein n=1 Tax=Chitinophaga defluvii TaxID=3163343 RepID=A0ABV2T6N7_9BACT